ncbi:WD40 repeat-like protein, partial [Aureobasidium melanogenum]
MDLDHSDSDTPDIDTDEEPEHVEHDEPEPMEGIEYSENLGSSPPISLPARRPSILRNHISSRLKPSRTPDRFVFDRTLNVQPRERFMLSTPPQELTANDRWSRRQSHVHDAFGSKTNITRRQNLAKSPAITRTPRTPSLFMSSRVNPLGLITPESPREISQGAVWNVGGSSPAQPVDGVRSISNGRGGRITSGTNAPMFRSDFSNHVHDDTDHLHIHGKRLSAAMGVDQANRVLDQGSGLLTPSRSPDVDTAGGFSPSVWRNNEWTKPGSPPLQRVQCKPRKTVPVIPFR